MRKQPARASESDDVSPAWLHVDELVTERLLPRGARPALELGIVQRQKGHDRVLHLAAIDVNPAAPHGLVAQRCSRGGETRFRAAPLAELGSAPATILFDDEAFGGIAIKDPRLVTLDDSAYFLPDDGNTRALRLSTGGVAQPVTLEAR